VVQPSDEILEPEKDTYICSICEDKILLDDTASNLPKCRICNETEYYKKQND